MKLAARVLALVALVLGIAAASLLAQQRADAARVRQQLIGTYKLISYVSYDENGKTTELPYSAGQISYDAAGRMSAQLMRADVPATTGAAPTGAQGGRGGGGAGGYVAYFGRYEIDADNGRVFHHVEGSVSRNMVGSAMPRWYEFSSDGGTLFLMTKNGDRVTGRLRWERYK
jgi:hypothetical protein